MWRARLMRLRRRSVVGQRPRPGSGASCGAGLTGNRVVLRPSGRTPVTTLRLAELAADLFPPGVFNVVTGHGDTVGQALVSHPRVRMSSLTGDTATGKIVARAGAEN